MNNIVNENDFKYYMQDIERYYFGARYNYNELLNNEMVPFKFKRVISKYLSDTIDSASTLESHLYYMGKEDYEYSVYKQLKARVRTSVYKKEGTNEKGFKEKIYKIEELVRLSKEEKELKGIIVRELITSKLALFAFSI